MISFSRSRVPLVPGSIVLVLAALLGYRGLVAGQSHDLPVLYEAPRFTLIDQFGRPVHSNAFSGKIIVANFIYTSCTDICPLLSVHMQALQQRLRQEHLLGEQVQLLSFTGDPARDTPEVLQAYAERHRADPTAWRFLTGSQDQVVPLIEEGFHLGIQELPPVPTDAARGDAHATHVSYEVSHSGRFVLIDRQGRIRAYYDGRAFDPEQVISDIRQLLE